MRVPTYKPARGIIAAAEPICSPDGRCTYALVPKCFVSCVESKQNLPGHERTGCNGQRAVDATLNSAICKLDGEFPLRHAPGTLQSVVIAIYGCVTEHRRNDVAGGFRVRPFPPDGFIASNRTTRTKAPRNAAPSSGILSSFDPLNSCFEVTRSRFYKVRFARFLKLLYRPGRTDR